MLRLLFTSILGWNLATATNYGLTADPRPITRIVQLLQDMASKIEEDQRQDQKTYDKYQCWCEKNMKSFTEAQEQAKAELERLSAEITAATAAAAEKNAEIGAERKSLAEAQKSLKDLVSFREKQLAEFSSLEVEYTQSITALEGALVVLAKHKGGAATLLHVTGELKNKLTKHKDMLDELLSAVTKKQPAFLESGDTQPTFTQGYGSQSGEILGILSQMKDTFTADLAEAREKEATDKSSHAKLKATKETEIKNSEDAITKKTKRKAEKNQEASDKTQQVADIRASMEGDLEFLEQVKRECPKATAEWNRRSAARTEELGSIAQAVKILDNDQARDLLTKTTAFVQVAKSSSSEERNRAAAVLKKLNKPEINLLAEQLKLKPMQKVKDAVKQMAVDLKQQMEEEVKQNDQCIQDQHQNEKDITAKENEKEGEERQKESLETELSVIVDTDIVAQQAAFADAEKNLKTMAEQRAEENKEFQANLGDQQNTVELLDQALTVLGSFYDSVDKKVAEGQTAVSFTQQPDRHPEQPEFFKPTGQQAGGSSVLEMLKGIKKEAVDAIATLKQTEQEAFKNFSDAKNAIRKVKNEAENALITLNAQKAEKEGDIADMSQAIRDTVGELQALDQTKQNLAAQCNFLVKNFDIRQSGFQTEIEALHQALAILSGSGLETAMAEAGLVQKSKGFLKK